MKPNLPDASPWVVRGMYFFAFLLVFWPVADFVTNTVPLQFGNPQWRYGFAGLMAGYLNTPLLGLVLAIGLALWQRHGGVLRFLAVIQVLGALVLLLVMAMFALDVVQVRAGRPPASLPSFIAGAVISEGKHFTSVVALLLLGIGSWKSVPRQAESRADPGIMMPQRTRS